MRRRGWPVWVGGEARGGSRAEAGSRLSTLHGGRASQFPASIIGLHGRLRRYTLVGSAAGVEEKAESFYGDCSRGTVVSLAYVLVAAGGECLLNE